MTPKEYEDGRAARDAGQSKDACPYGNTTAGVFTTDIDRRKSQIYLRAWWMAGWDDRDMEMLRV